MLLLAAFVVLLGPRIWERLESLHFDTDYRVPYELASDYWLYERLARDATKRADVVLMGDSVVWGHYVNRDQTLSHYLNAQTGSARFANLGLDGAHPAALAGLIEYHAAAVTHKKVILHCNPLWISSPKHDLRETEEFRFNHPALVPQFVPRIPCYREEVSRRIGYVVERNVPYYAWINHLQLAYFGQTSIPEWTLEHPYANPLGPLVHRKPVADRSPEQPISWTQRHITAQDLPWVGLETSFQWRSFRRAVEVLRQRDNRLFVVIGPFNLHLLEAASKAVYLDRVRAMTGQLAQAGIVCLAPETLASEQYADASHPLAEGYAALARQLLANPAFAEFAK